MDADTKIMMEKIASDAAQAAVEGTLIKLGIDHNNPIDAQKDMAALRDLRDLVENDEFQKDLLHLRKWRITMDGVQSKGFVAAAGFATLGFFAFILYYLREKTGI